MYADSVFNDTKLDPLTEMANHCIIYLYMCDAHQLRLFFVLISKRFPFRSVEVYTTMNVYVYSIRRHQALNKRRLSSPINRLKISIICTLHPLPLINRPAYPQPLDPIKYHKAINADAKVFWLSLHHTIHSTPASIRLSPIHFFGASSRTSLLVSSSAARDECRSKIPAASAALQAPLMIKLSSFVEAERVVGLR